MFVQKSKIQGPSLHPLLPPPIVYDACFLTALNAGVNTWLALSSSPACFRPVTAVVPPMITGRMLALSRHESSQAPEASTAVDPKTARVRQFNCLPRRSGSTVEASNSTHWSQASTSCIF